MTPASITVTVDAVSGPEIVDLFDISRLAVKHGGFRVW